MKHPLLKQNAEVPKEEVEAVSESSTSFVSKAASPQWDGWGPWRKRRQDFPTCVGKKAWAFFRFVKLWFFCSRQWDGFAWGVFASEFVFLWYIYICSLHFHTFSYESVCGFLLLMWYVLAYEDMRGFLAFWFTRGRMLFLEFGSTMVLVRRK